jgi:hypothetical protein
MIFLVLLSTFSSSTSMMCTWENPQCPQGYRCQLQWSEGPFYCVVERPESSPPQEPEEECRHPWVC